MGRTENFILRHHICDDGVIFIVKKRYFPGSPVVKDEPASAADMASIPDPGRLHVLRGNEAPAPQLVSAHTATVEARVPRAHAQQ